MPEAQPQPERSVIKIAALIPQKLRTILQRRRDASSESNGSKNIILKPLADNEDGGSVIHPDIEEGARHILETDLEEMVRTGNTAGIMVCIRSLGEAWIQAQKAAGATFELTSEGRQEVPSRVKEICARHLSDGLARIFEVTEFGVQSGWEYSITQEPDRITDLFQIAGEFQIPLSYLPSHNDTQPVEDTLAIIITTSEQALTHMQHLIDRNLPQGLLSIVKTLGFQVGQGLLNQLPEYEQKIERWIGIMEQRGWAVIDDSTTHIVEGELQQGVLPRQVNRAEIRQLIDQVIYNNLAKGARHISEMVEFSVRSGWCDPLQTWGNPDNISLYAEAGEKYEITHSGGVAAEGAAINTDLYFDPLILPRHIDEAVRRTFPDGFRAIIARHLQNVREGDAGQIDFGEQTLEQYIRLAKEYGVHINPEKLRQELTSHITVENLRQGVVFRMNAVKEAIRKANYLGVSVYARDAESFRQYVDNKGFYGKVDFTELDRYLEQTATQVPRLTD